MDFTENKAVFEDCVCIIKDIQNINDIDAIRYLVSEDLDRVDLTECMKFYFTEEIIEPMNRRLDELDENGEEYTLRGFYCEYLNEVFNDKFKHARGESYEFILNEIICDDSYNLWNIISDRIEKNKKNLDESSDTTYEDDNSPLYENIEQGDMTPFQYRLYTMGLNFQTEYNVFVDFINKKDEKQDEISQEELQLVKVVLCNAMDKLLKICAIYTQNEELINSPTILYKADEILTSWPITEELKSEFLRNKDEFMNVILGKYKAISEKLFERFSEYFLKLTSLLGDLIKSH